MPSAIPNRTLGPPAIPVHLHVKGKFRKETESIKVRQHPSRTGESKHTQGGREKNYSASKKWEKAVTGGETKKKKLGEKNKQKMPKDKKEDFKKTKTKCKTKGGQKRKEIMEKAMRMRDHP